MDAQVSDNPQRSRFEARLGDEVAGFLAYEPRDGAVALMHTIVEPEHEGQGVAGRLVQAAVDQARSEGTSVLPYCSYVRAWLGRHPEAADLVPAERRAEFDL